MHNISNEFLAGKRIQLIKKTGQPYQEKGGNYFSELDQQHAERRLTKQLERLGYQVTLTPTKIAWACADIAPFCLLGKFFYEGPAAHRRGIFYLFFRFLSEEEQCKKITLVAWQAIVEKDLAGPS